MLARAHNSVKHTHNSVFARCGTVGDLVPDVLLETGDILNNHLTHQQAAVANKELGDSVNWLLWDPLLLALQHGQAVAVQCHHCQPAEPLRLLSINRSGSGAEGLSDRIIGGDNYDTTLESDGHFRWAADCISPEAASQLWPKPTGSPGFVTLHWVMTTRCRCNYCAFLAFQLLRLSNALIVYASYLFGPFFNVDNEGIVIRHAVVNALTALMGSCDEGSAEEQWVKSQLLDVLDLMQLDVAQRSACKRNVCRVLCAQDGVEAVG